jgi:hypothetical protein
LDLNSTGGINITNPLGVAGTLTVNSSSIKDLSKLSKSGNLNGKDPVNLGSGTYVAPGN